MTEYFFGIEYLNMKPSSIEGFQLIETGEKPKPLPRVGERIKLVLNALAPSGTRPDAEHLKFSRMVRSSDERMSDGRHLDGLVIVQTGDHDDPGYYLGAT